VVAVVQPDAGDIHLDLDDVGIDAVDGGAEGFEQHSIANAGPSASPRDDRARLRRRANAVTWGAAEYTDDRPGRKRLFYSRDRNSHRGTADLEIGSSGDLDAEPKKERPQ